MTPPALLQRLERFSPDDAKILAQWLEKQPVGINLGLQLLELLEDLAKKEGRPVSDFFAEMPEGEQLQAKERGRVWRERLERRLHPHLKAHASAFAGILRCLALPEGAEIDPPQGFEGRGYTLKVSFADKEELRQRLLRVAESLEKEDWEGLWEF